MTLLTKIRPKSGAVGVVEPAREYITDINTVADMWPFGKRSPQAQNGIPLGLDASGSIGCYDPYSSFMAGHQRAAQLGIVATNGLGKSLVAKKIATGYTGIGIPTIVPFDTKNEYQDLVKALGGSTLRIGRDGGLNLLDPGECIQQAINQKADPKTLTELKARRNQLVATVVALTRNAPLAGWEEAALNEAIELLPPATTVKHLPEVFTHRMAHLASILNRPVDRAETLLEPLSLDVAALAAGPIGQALGTAGSSQQWRINAPLAVDTSAVRQAEATLSAAVIVSCWTAAQSTIYLSNQLGKSRIHCIIFDEIWRGTREFPALANQIGGLLRMDRNEGIISILSTHSWTDTEQPGGSNIMARCAAFAIGGLQKAEINLIANAGLGLNDAELAEIRRNASGGTVNGKATGGVGRFLFKVGETPGRTIRTVITPTEQQLLDTNDQWTKD